ncbi:MAG: hypothetical protein JNL83_13490, partial [Myxococcales bacterium]|nr:hypothetical protein [Myxococcales bacterium]
MRTPWGIGAALALAIVASTSPARAQSADPPPFDSAIDVQTFNYAIGPKSFFTVSDGDVAAKKQLAIDALITYLTRPFTVYNVDPADPNMVGTERTQVVKSVAAMQITGAYGISDKLQVGARLPVIFQLEGEGLTPETGRPAMNGLSVTGLGDIDVEAKYRLYRKDKLK